MPQNIFDLSSYDYELPSTLIAQEPCTTANQSRLLICEIQKDNINMIDSNFQDFTNQVNHDYVIFFNNSKVIKSRLKLKDVKIITPNGEEKILNEGEIFFLKKVDSHTFESLVNPGKKFKPGTKILLDEYIFEVIDISTDGRILKANKPDYLDFFEAHGQLPLPPYIQYAKEKEKHYQPIFAKNPGSLASPTACLHFNENMISNIKEKGIDIEYASLHIGLGTFKLVNQQDIRDYDIHRETVEIDKDIFNKIASHKNGNKKILAVGTTVTRTLESLPYLWQTHFSSSDEFPLQTQKFWNELILNLPKKDFIFNVIESEDKVSFETKLFIYPGYKINIIDELITNFHLPKSSLLMLVSAFMGYKNVMQAYQHAIQNKYKFFSFGDAMRIKF